MDRKEERRGALRFTSDGVESYAFQDTHHREKYTVYHCRQGVAKK
jgi:hypothetical protein